ncbi:Uncharacterised protein [Klebsiella pneumoniae]|nr:Uncharacterised protein [Klebsiella pneumoniae]
MLQYYFEIFQSNLGHLNEYKEWWTEYYGVQQN